MRVVGIKRVPKTIFTFIEVRFRSHKTGESSVSLTRLVIINQIDIHNFTIYKSKNHPPVPRYTYAPLTLAIALECVQPKARCVDIFGLSCYLQVNPFAKIERTLVRSRPITSIRKARRFTVGPILAHQTGLLWHLRN